MVNLILFSFVVVCIGIIFLLFVTRKSLTKDLTTAIQNQNEINKVQNKLNETTNRRLDNLENEIYKK